MCVLCDEEISCGGEGLASQPARVSERYPECCGGIYTLEDKSKRIIGVCDPISGC